MSFTKDTDDTQTIKTQPSCRVSYILENDQPVLCTYIGIDPFFYGLDTVDEYEDEMMDDLSGDIFTLTKEELLETVEENLESAFPDYKRELSASEEATMALIKDTADFCTALEVFESNADINALTRRLYKSGTARLMIDEITQKGVDFDLNSQVSDVIYDRQASKIFVNPILDADYATLLMARELRRAWQHKQGVLIHPLTFHPDDAIIINRAQAADLVISQIRIAWELQLAEDKAVWDEIMKSNAKDMAHSFRREAKRDFRNLNNGWAAQVAFEKWFLTDRARLEDKELIQMMLADHQGYVFEDKEMSRMATIDLIASLGSMPIGKNYLSNMAQAIISDPMYAEIRDRSNANFLWFIKFEQSFRETERDLQLNTGSDNSAEVSKTADVSNEEEQQTSNVLEFPGIARNASEKGSSEGQGSVVDLSGLRS